MNKLNTVRSAVLRGMINEDEEYGRYCLLADRLDKTAYVAVWVGNGGALVVTRVDDIRPKEMSLYIAPFCQV